MGGRLKTMNGDDFKQQAFLRFADITQKSVEKKSNSSEERKLREKNNSPSKEEMQTKIATARVHANKEMDRFRLITEEYIKEVDKLCLFEEGANVIHDLMIEQLLEFIVEPTIKGQKIPGMPDESFKKFRVNMYKALIETYIDNK